MTAEAEEDKSSSSSSAAAAAAAAAVTADLEPGPRLGMSPATPDIVRNPVRPCRITGAIGSCCNALSAAAPALVEVDGFGSVPLPLPGGEQVQSAPKDLGEFDCAVSMHESGTLPAQPTESPGKSAQQQQQQQQQEGVQDGIDAGGARPAPIPTPDKVEPSPWRRRRKRSTKGIPRLKVVKDKFKKAKSTFKKSMPGNAKKRKKKNRQADGSENVVTGSPNIARRKLDLDLSESKTSFSRATLMGNLRCLAQSQGFQRYLSTRLGAKRGKKRKSMMAKHQETGELAIVRYQRTQADGPSSALVPLAGCSQLDIVPHGNGQKKPQVLGLNEETLQIYEVLKKHDEDFNGSYEGVDIGRGPDWDERRRRFAQWVDIFISEVHSLMGSRKFSQWEGSVTDSVVGVFLTQNVSDHLSSKAFMEMAAKFPPRNRCCKAEECSNEPSLVDDLNKNLNFSEAAGNVDYVGSDSNKNVDSKKESCHVKEVKGHYGPEYNTVIENFIANMKEKDISTWNSDLINLAKHESGKEVVTEITLKRFIGAWQQKDTSHWDKLREEAYRNGYTKRSGTETSDAVDWESVERASFQEVMECINVRGQHNILALRIQAFLRRIKKDHGSFDLDWLRYVPPESARNFLLSIQGLGDKSVDCVRLLSLRHKAFPVDVNVAHIVTRLGWVELQPLNGLEFNLYLYPILSDIQRYLWPRLCTIDEEKLYELHYLMITFGKVICTKANPNCSACPFSKKCKYYSTSLKRLFLTSPEEHDLRHSKEQTSVVTSGLVMSNGSCAPSFQQMREHQIEISEYIHNCEPIIEVPPSPEYEYEEVLTEEEGPYEDDVCDIEDVVQGVRYDAEIDLTSIKHVVNDDSWAPSCGEDLALTTPQYHFGTYREQKNIGRLRTKHNAYVLRDDSVILKEFEERVPEDSCPYLLVSSSSPNNDTMKGTILIPCRTANRGKFPLNGTYFQQNEVFADHSSSHSPITICRNCLANLKPHPVYFGSSIQSITKGQTKQDIEECLKTGFICVRGFDRNTRMWTRLCSKLHVTNKNDGGENRTKRPRTSPKGKNNQKASPEN
ncbi:hypothetical protein ACP4OV_005732 [Aristida adscensionis]